MWNLVAGAGIGALGGAMKKKPMKYTPIQQITDLDYRQQYGQGAMDYLQEMGQGGAPLMSQAEITRQLSGGYGRLAAKEAAESLRINERALGRQGRMSGMAEAGLAELGRAGLGEARALESGVQNQLAAMTPEMRLRATGMGLSQANADQQQYADEQHRKFQQDMARQQFSKWGNILGGAVAGASAMSGMGGMFGGGGAGGGGAMGGGGMGTFESGGTPYSFAADQYDGGRGGGSGYWDMTNNTFR